MDTPLPDQLPTALREIAVLNLYLGSIVLLIGIIVVAIVIRRNGRFILSKFIMISTLLIVISIPVSLFVWRIWGLEIDIMFGPIHLPTLIAILIVDPLLLKLFGYKIFSKKIFCGDKSENQTITNKQINESIQNFDNRPIHKVLTKDIIERTIDDDLEQFVFDNISILDNDQKEEFEFIQALSKGQQMVYSTWMVEAEVNNGGFDLFYINSSRKFAEMAVEGFKLVGADEFSKLMEKANKIFIENRERLEAFDDGTVESFSKSYKNNPLNDLDQVFFDLYKSEDLKALKAKYIRENMEEFIQ